MGTPAFAVPSLEIILRSGYHIAAVVTAPDKPAGRGLKTQCSPIKTCALQHKIPVLQPVNLKDESFLKELQEINPNLQIVVAFRMLPESVWAFPNFGTINLHASILPNYRGAAPINWAIINGETETGATTFFLNNQIDTGDIIDRIKLPISPTETAGELHDILMLKGAELLISTIKKIESNETITQAQNHFNLTRLSSAPKIFKQHCKIDWNQPVEQIYNLIRGLNPSPAAFTELISPKNISFNLKILQSDLVNINSSTPFGTVEVNNNHLQIWGKNGFLKITELQLSGKKRMTTSEFLNGFNIDSNWKVL